MLGFAAKKRFPQITQTTSLFRFVNDVLNMAFLLFCCPNFKLAARVAPFGVVTFWEVPAEWGLSRFQDFFFGLGLFRHIHLAGGVPGKVQALLSGAKFAKSGTVLDVFEQFALFTFFSLVLMREWLPRAVCANKAFWAHLAIFREELVPAILAKYKSFSRHFVLSK